MNELAHYSCRLVKNENLFFPSRRRLDKHWLTYAKTRNYHWTLEMKKTKTTYMIMANVVAILLLVLGLLSPLTPSEGTPSFLVIAIFAGGPLFILSALIYKTESKIAKIFFITEIAVIATILFQLLRIFCKYSTH